MKIAHVSPEFYPAIGGVGQVVRELAKRQVKAGNEVHVFVPDWDKKKRIRRKEEIIDGIHVHRCTYLAQMGNFSTFWPSLLPRLLNGNFDIIHSHLFGHPHFIMSALAAKIKGIPHIHTTHCPWSDAPRSAIGRFGILISYNLISGLALLATDKIIAITPWENKFIERFGGSRKKIINIPNGMDEKFFKKIKNNDFKKKNKISKKIILFFGRLSFTKAPDKFVEIARLVLKKRKDVTFILRGPDEGLKDKVKSMIKNEKGIILMDETMDREEIIKMYQSADIFVLPSYREGLPLTLFEAMASGLPVLATPVNGVKYELENGKNGFLIGYGKNEEFSNKIITLLDNEKLRKKIIVNNLEKARDFSWDIINKRTLKIYEMVKR